MADEQWTAAPGRPVPTTGATDELLADPPAGPPPGGLDGYRAGRKVRYGIFGVLALAVLGTGWLVNRWQATEEAERRAPKLPVYTLSPEVDDAARPRQLVWSEGFARLGLARAQPGVEEILLPDRRVRLAPGHDVAQIKVEVRDGRTVSLTVLVGRVVELPLEAGPEAPPAPTVPPATVP